jgi:hypothetical protein
VVGEHETDKYLLFTAMVVAQEDLGRPPLVWQKGGFFGLNTT